jgi:O-antigen/teichoic acid export membrane protein
LYRKPELVGTFRLFSPALPFLSLLAVTAAISRSRGEMKYAAVFQDVGQPLMGLALLLGLWIFFGASTEVVILADVLSFAAAAGVGLWFVRRMFGGHPAQAGTGGPGMREILAYSLPTAVAGTLSVLVFWIDRLLVGYYLPGEANGLYQAASQVSILFVLVLAGFNAVLAPLFAEGHARGEHDRLETAYQYGTKWGLYVSMPIFIVIALAPRQTLAALFGGSYADAALPMVVLAVGQMLNVATGAVGPLLMMAGQQRLWMRLALAALVLNMAVCVVAIPRLGITGAALSTSLCLGAMYSFAVIRAKDLLGLWPYHRRYLKGLVAAACTAVVVLGLSTALRQWRAEFLAFTLLVASAVCFAGALLALRLDAEDRALLEVAVRWLGSRTLLPIGHSEGAGTSRGRDAP